MPTLANTPIKSSRRSGVGKVEVVTLKLIRNDDLNDSHCVIEIVDSVGNEVGRVYARVLDSKLDLWTLACKVKTAIEKRFFTKGCYAYRLLPGAQNEVNLIDTVKDVMQKGTGELKVVKHRASTAEIMLRKELLRNKLKFKWKTYLEGYLVDFHIVGGESIVVDIVETAPQQILGLKEKMRRLVNGGHICYFLKEEEIFRCLEKYIEMIKEVLNKRRLYPNGLLVEELKVDETTSPIEILVKLQTVNTPSGVKVRFINVFEISEADAAILGTMKISRRLWSFIKVLSNILWEKGYWYDTKIDSYSDIFSKLMRFGEVRFNVSKIARESNGAFFGV